VGEYRGHVTVASSSRRPSSLVLPAQFGLFLVMWWAHLKNQAQRDVERDQRQKDAMRERQQRVSRAREETAANTD